MPGLCLCGNFDCCGTVPDSSVWRRGIQNGAVNVKRLANDNWIDLYSAMGWRDSQIASKLKDT